MGRRTIGDRPMTAAERQIRHRLKASRTINMSREDLIRYLGVAADDYTAAALRDVSRNNIDRNPESASRYLQRAQEARTLIQMIKMSDQIKLTD